jgi:uncharacterized protein (DUF488 family)
MHEIDVLGDVRSFPFSRFNPQFNRQTLEQALKQQKLRYVFLGKTGTPTFACAPSVSAAQELQEFDKIGFELRAQPYLRC